MLWFNWLLLEVEIDQPNDSHIGKIKSYIPITSFSTKLRN